MRKKLDLNALAEYVELLDSDPEFAENDFAFDFQDHRVYCERKKSHMRLEIGSAVFELPR